MSALTFAIMAEAKNPVDFQQEIRPILAEHCFECHGPDEQTSEAGLRLDQREAALAKGAIGPAKPLESELIQRLRSSDPDVVMPPADHNSALAPEQIKRHEHWIEEGAHYAKHWAFIAPQKAATTGDEPNHPIDAFIGERSTPTCPMTNSLSNKSLEIFFPIARRTSPWRPVSSAIA